VLVESEDQARELAEKLSQTTYVVIDTETHKTDQYYNKELLGVAIGIPEGLELRTYYVLPEQFRGNQLLWKALQSCEWIGHNLKFDLEIIRENGLDFQGPIWDTQIMVHLCDENQTDYSLDLLGLRLFGDRKMDMKPFEKGFDGWHNIPPVIMGNYAEQDLRITWKLFQKYLGQLRDQDLVDLWPVCMEYVRTLQLLIRSGIRIDRDLLSVLRREAATRLSELEAQLAGVGILNPGSQKQVRKYLYHDLKLPVKAWTNPPKKKDGTRSAPQPSVDSAAINDFIEDKPELDELLGPILEYRKLAKALSTWYNGFLEKMGDRDYLHPGLKQHGTKTGRLSCAEPNLQQIPRDAARAKRMFIGDGDFALVEFDYSQIELRIGAYFAKKFDDDTMFEVYKEGGDVHTLTGEMIGSIEHLGHKEGRQVGKTGNFLWIYQGGAKRLRTTLWRDAKMRVSLPQCEEWTQQFHRAYPGFLRANLAAARVHQRLGYVKMYNGRRRRIKTKNDRNQTKHYVSFNAVVQGSAGQILMEALNGLANLQRAGAPFRLCNTIHDSCWCYIPKDKLEEASELIIKTMRAPAERQFWLPFDVDRKILGE
jgi:DNA polymerase-1